MDHHQLPSSPSCLLRVSLFVLAIIIVIPSLASSVDDDDEQQLMMMMDRFHGWMAAHGRSYPTAEEKLRRFHIYRDNMEFVEATNRNTSLPYTCGENQFSDLSHEEFLAMYTMPASRPVSSPSSSVITTRAGDVVVPENNARCKPRPDLPERVDWRERGAVTHVKNQLRGCNACWIFAAVATIESAHKIVKKGKLISLSEQEIADCSDQHCSGGLPQDVYKWAMSHGGIAMESNYSRRYDAKKHSCDAAELPPAAAVRIRDYEFVEELCEPRLAVRVARQPVAVRFDATDPGFRFYKKGIYVWPGKKSYDLNHAMAIVGYGKDDATGLNYWIAKNSWAQDWGEGGFVRLHKDVPGEPQGVAGLVLRPPTYPKV